jgi:hypothetical protein
MTVVVASCWRNPGPALPKERPMRKWLVPLTVLGVGGVGALFFTDKGKESLRRLRTKFLGTPERWVEWNKNIQLELDGIQASLDQIAESLGPRGQLGH